MMRKWFVWTLVLMICFVSSVMPAFGAEGQVIEYSWYRSGASKPSGTLSSANFEDGWNDIMDKANSGFPVHVKLLADWVAVGGEFTDDPLNGPGFEEDIIRVNEGTCVVLDMNGFSIDRGTTLDVKNGEVIHVCEGADLTLKNGTVIGSVHITDGNEVIVDNCVFKDNEDIDFGAAVYSEGCEELRVEHCVFSNLEDDSNGAGIEAYETSLTVIGSAFRNCTTEHNGAAMYVKNGALDVTNCQFTGNLSENGGAVACEDTKSNFSSCTFGNNTAYGHGGALFVTGKEEAATMVYLSNLADNTAWENGGAVAVDGSASVTIHGCIVDENTALSNGGAVYVGQKAAFDARDYNDELAKDIHVTKFIENHAAEKGNVIFLDTEDGGMEEGEAWVEPTGEDPVSGGSGFNVTNGVLVLACVFVAITIGLNFRKK